MRSSSRFKKVAAALQRSVSRLFNNTVVPSIPVDVLLAILEHVDKATLATLCRVNKIFCSCSQDVLYREICHRDKRVIPTLAQSTDLARRVRSFGPPHTKTYLNLPRALQNMINLRHLDLGYLGYSNTDIFNVLVGCTFTLVSFSGGGPQFQPLHQFLLGQPSLTSLSLRLDNSGDWPEFGATCLPNLTRVAAPFSKLPLLVPNRPVKEVISLGTVREGNSVDISFFTLSNSPIQKLKIDYTYLYPKSGQYLTSIFSSLTTLEITTLEITANTNRFLAIVRESPFF
jgi:F-box-like